MASLARDGTRRQRQPPVSLRTLTGVQIVRQQRPGRTRPPSNSRILSEVSSWARLRLRANSRRAGRPSQASTSPHPISRLTNKRRPCEGRRFCISRARQVRPRHGPTNQAPRIGSSPVEFHQPTPGRHSRLRKVTRHGLRRSCLDWSRRAPPLRHLQRPHQRQAYRPNGKVLLADLPRHCAP